MQLPFAVVKTAVISGDAAITQAVATKYGLVETGALSVRRLGVDVQYQMPQRQKAPLRLVSKKRFKIARRRVPLLKKLNVGGHLSQRVFVGGLVPATLFGCDVVVPDLKDVEWLRRQHLVSAV